MYHVRTKIKTKKFVAIGAHAEPDGIELFGMLRQRRDYLEWRLVFARLFGSSALPSGISGRSVKSPPRFIPALFGDSRKMAAVPLYCVCRQPYDVNRFMIECDICKDWFHGR